MSLPAAKTELTVVMTSFICDLASSPFQIAFQNSESDPYAADTVTGIVVLLPALKWLIPEAELFLKSQEKNRNHRKKEHMKYTLILWQSD